jgi:hypothetical protein
MEAAVRALCAFDSQTPRLLGVPHVECFYRIQTVADRDFWLGQDRISVARNFFGNERRLQATCNAPRIINGPGTGVSRARIGTWMMPSSTSRGLF